MRSLEFVAPRQLRWRESADLAIEHDHEAIVAPVVATTCDLDRAIIAGATPFAGPFDLGHECVARVMELGMEGSRLSVGDLVIVPWHLSCGSCANCLKGFPSECTTTPRNAMFGLPAGGAWGGMFSEQLRVPYADGSLVPLPASVSPEAAASVSDGMTDAYTSLLQGLTAHPGERVLIAGGLNHGLFAVSMAVAMGSGPVTYIDLDPRRREIAAGYGVRVIGDFAELDGEEFLVALDASANPVVLSNLLRTMQPGGHCHSVGIYFRETKLPLMEMYMNTITFTTGRPDITPHAPDVLNLIASGHVDPLPIFSETIAFEDLGQALLELPTKPLILF